MVLGPVYQIVLLAITRVFPFMLTRTMEVV